MQYARNCHQRRQDGIATLIHNSMKINDLNRCTEALDSARELTVKGLTFLSRVVDE